MREKITLLIDFDGVIHSYKSGWQGATSIPDPPVPGAFSWLDGLIVSGKFATNIYSSRSKEPGGIDAMQRWFARHEFERWSELEFPTEKPAAFLTIDDRAICFNGVFPTHDEIRSFQPWYKRDTPPRKYDLFNDFVEGHLRAMKEAKSYDEMQRMLSSLLKAFD